MSILPVLTLVWLSFLQQRHPASDALQRGECNGHVTTSLEQSLVPRSGSATPVRPLASICDERRQQLIAVPDPGSFLTAYVSPLLMGGLQDEMGPPTPDQRLSPVVLASWGTAPLKGTQSEQSPSDSVEPRFPTSALSPSSAPDAGAPATSPVPAKAFDASAQPASAQASPIEIPLNSGAEQPSANGIASQPDADEGHPPADTDSSESKEAAEKLQPDADEGHSHADTDSSASKEAAAKLQPDADEAHSHADTDSSDSKEASEKLTADAMGAHSHADTDGSESKETAKNLAAHAMDANEGHLPAESDSGDSKEAAEKLAADAMDALSLAAASGADGGSVPFGSPLHTRPTSSAHRAESSLAVGTRLQLGGHDSPPSVSPVVIASAANAASAADLDGTGIFGTSEDAVALSSKPFTLDILGGDTARGIQDGEESDWGSLDEPYAATPGSAHQQPGPFSGMQHRRHYGPLGKQLRQILTPK